VIFNPSFPYRLTHMLLASGLTVAFLTAGLSAYRRLRGERSAEVAATQRTGVLLAATLIPVQIFIGDLHGLNTLEHQPAKIAAMEAIWDTERGADLRLFAWPDEATRSNRFEITIPNAASLILTHSRDGELRGLNSFEDHPPVAPVFFAFRIMVGVGLLMLAISWLAAWQTLRRGEPAPLVQRGLLAMTFSGWLAVLAGWYTTEIGRQPWLVHGVLKTADAASGVSAGMIGLTLGLYLTLYAVLIVAYVWVLFYMARKAGAGDAPGGEPMPARVP
jgi:cytochrome d ubiquinol oxidase subunit I